MTTRAEPLVSLPQLLASPTTPRRVMILWLIGDGVAHNAAIADAMGESRSSISYDINTLAEGRLIKRGTPTGRNPRLLTLTKRGKVQLKKIFG